MWSEYAIKTRVKTRQVLLHVGVEIQSVKKHALDSKAKIAVY